MGYLKIIAWFLAVVLIGLSGYLTHRQYVNYPKQQEEARIEEEKMKLLEERLGADLKKAVQLTEEYEKLNKKSLFN